MYSNFVVLCCILVFTLNIWILLGHRNQLGSESSDKSFDLFYSNLSSKISFLFIIILEGIFCFRRCLLELDYWSLVSKNYPWLFFLDLYTFKDFFFFGILLFFLGFALRIWSVYILGKFFTFEIGIRKDHTVITNGPYRYLRHPSYTGYLLMSIGMGLMYGSWPNLFCFFGSCFLFLSIRIYFEEKMLRENLGEAYVEYSKKSKRLIPWVY